MLNSSPHKKISVLAVAIAIALSLFQAVAEENAVGELAVGLSLQEGNSDTRAINLGLKSDRTGGDVERLLRADFAYGEDEGEKSTENAKGMIQYNWLFAERAYVHMRGTLAYDDVADLDYRATLGPPGIGYYLANSEDAKLGIELAFEYLWEKVGGDARDAPILRLTQRGEKKIGASSKIWNSIDYIPEVDEFANYLVVAEVGVEAALTKRVNLRVVFRDTYDSEPAAGKKENDIALLSGLVVKL